MVSAAEAGLEVDQNRVDPFELRQLPGFASAHDDGVVLATGVGHPGKASQAVRDHHATGSEGVAGPLGNGLARESRHGCHFGVDRVALRIGRDRCNERHLVLGAARGLAAGELAAKVGIVHLDHAA